MDQGKSEYYEFLDLTDVDDSERYLLNNTLFPHEQAPPGEPPPQLSPLYHATTRTHVKVHANSSVQAETRIWQEGISYPPYVVPAENRGLFPQQPPVVAAPFPLPLYALVHPHQEHAVNMAAEQDQAPSAVTSSSSLSHTDSDYSMNNEQMSPHSNGPGGAPGHSGGYQFTVPPPNVQGPPPHGHMYQMMPPPLSNVYVGNVTANVNVHGYMGHYVPQYLQQDNNPEVQRPPREYNNRGRRGRGGHKREYMPRTPVPDMVDPQQHQGYQQYIQMPFQATYYHPPPPSHMAQHATGSPLYLGHHMPMYAPQMYGAYPPMMYQQMGLPPEYQMMEQDKMEQNLGYQGSEISVETDSGYHSSCPMPGGMMATDYQQEILDESLNKPMEVIDQVQECVDVPPIDFSVPPPPIDSVPLPVHSFEPLNDITEFIPVFKNNVSETELSKSVQALDLDPEPVPVPIQTVAECVSSVCEPVVVVSIEQEPVKVVEEVIVNKPKPKGPFVNNKNIVKTVPRKSNVKPLNNGLPPKSVNIQATNNEEKPPDSPPPQQPATLVGNQSRAPPNPPRAWLKTQPISLSEKSSVSPHTQNVTTPHPPIAALQTQKPLPQAWARVQNQAQPISLTPTETEIQNVTPPVDENSSNNKTPVVPASPVAATSQNEEASPAILEPEINKENVATVPKPEQSSASTAAVASSATNKSWASLFTGQKQISNQSTFTDTHPNRPIAMVQPFDSAPALVHTVDAPLSTDSSKPESLQRNQPLPLNANPALLADPNLYRMGEFLKKYRLDNRTVSLQPRGLTNRSNYCYINSTLQALLACPPLYNLLKALPYQTKKGKSTTPIIDAMVQLAYEFDALPPGARVGRKEKGQRREDNPPDVICGPAFEPHMIHRMLGSICTDTFQVEGRQEDAEEFLGCLLNGLNDEMLELLKLVDEPQENEVSLTNGSVSKAAETQNCEEDDDWKVISGPKNKGSITRRSDFGRSPISDIFRGQLRSRVQRAGDLTTDNVQPFFTLQLDIEKAANVPAALELLVGRDQLEGVTCAKTNQEVKAWQQVSLEELPLVLILHLKWFDYKLDGCTKIMKTVEFPIDLKVDSKIMSAKIKYSTKQRQYKLFAIVYHDGKDASKGHYITDVFHVGFNGWIRFDDSTVKAVTEQTVLHPKVPRVPYLLYYRRCDTIGPVPVATPPTQQRTH